MGLFSADRNEWALCVISLCVLVESGHTMAMHLLGRSGRTAH